MNQPPAIASRKTLRIGFVLLSFIVILGVAYSLFIYATVQENALAENREANLVQAETAARFIAGEQQGLLSLLGVIASRASLRQALAREDVPALEAFFHPVLDLGPGISSVFLQKAGEGLLVRVPKLPDGVLPRYGPNLGQFPMVSGLVPLAQSADRSCLLLTVPVKSPAGDILAHLGISQLPSHWQALFGQVSSRPGRTFFLFDRGGVLITGGLAKAELPAQFLTGLAGKVRGEITTGKDKWAGLLSPAEGEGAVFAAASLVPVSGWTVVVLHNYRAAMATAGAMQRNILLLLALLFLCLLFVGFMLLTRFRAQDLKLVRLDDQARQLEALVKERTMDLEMSTQRYLSLVQDLPDIVYELDQKERFTFVSQAVERILGFKPKDMLGRTYREFVLPEDRPQYDAQRERSRPGRSMNIVALRHLHSEQKECWLSIHSQGLFDTRGDFLGRRGVARDITGQVRAEERIHQLSGQLINAQEEERKQLAMDLHDEMGQLLSALKIGLQTLARTNSEERASLDRLIGLTQEIMDRSRNLAYRLRPAILDSFGITASVADLCESLHEDGILAVETNLEQIDDGALGPVVKTTIFRFVQEALTNVIKHSGSDRVSVRLKAEGDMIRAEVRDHGRGFDLEKVVGQGGPKRLGLLGMHERLHLIGGRLDIKTSKRGTLLRAELPLGGMK